MVRSWRARSGRGKIAFEAEAGIAEQLGILPCSAVGCAERTGIACDHIDRRGRLCGTAWCPEHRHPVGDSAFCAIHAARAINVPTLSREPAAAIVTWIAAAAEDDVVAVLNDLTRRVPSVTETESLRATADAEGNRIWCCAWRLRGKEGVIGRISIGVSESDVDHAVLSVDDGVVRSIELPRFVRETDPGHSDLNWLMREVMAPISAAVGLRGTEAVETSLSGTRATMAPREQR